MSCCLDHNHPNLRVDEIAYDGANKEFSVKGVVDRTPSDRITRFSRVLQWMDLIEKIAEIADESFHLFKKVLENHASVEIYNKLRNLHHAAHEIEHMLHAFCFLGDITRILSGKFLEYRDREHTNVDYLRTAARICHAVAHFCASLQFLSDLNLFKSSRFDQAMKFVPLISATGYALWTATLLWRRYQGEENKHFKSDIGIYLGGFLFEAIPLTKEIAALASYTAGINKLSAIAGIIHAGSLAARLMPQDREKVKATFIAPDDLFISSGYHPVQAG